MTLDYNGRRLRLSIGHYSNGNTAVEAIDTDGEPYTVLSVNMPPYDRLPDGVFYLKDWSENAMIAAALIGSGLIERAPGFPRRVSGFVWADAYQFVKENA